MGIQYYVQIYIINMQCICCVIYLMLLCVFTMRNWFWYIKWLVVAFNNIIVWFDFAKCTIFKVDIFSFYSSLTYCLKHNLWYSMCICIFNNILVALHQFYSCSVSVPIYFVYYCDRNQHNRVQLVLSILHIYVLKKWQEFADCVSFF